VRALVAEDDESLGGALALTLQQRGYVVDLVTDGASVLSYSRWHQYSVAVIGWQMPRMPGIDVVRELRRRGDSLPVLMLSSKAEPQDLVVGLDAGADDYLVKPFDFGELLARLRALQRRPASVLSPALTVGDLEYDQAGHEVRSGDRRLALTPIELGILETLMRLSPAIANRRQIAQQVWWDIPDPFGSNTIDVHMARLRRKLTGTAARIETVRSFGYRLVVADGCADADGGTVTAGSPRLGLFTGR
jgi:two-component system, OmpR family, response regulator